MAEDAEKKNISRLDFDIGNSIKKLQDIEAQMKSLSTISDATFKNIEKNFSKGLNISNVKLNDSQLKQINVTAEKEAIKTSEKIKRLEAETTAYKERQAIKQANAIERQNNQVVKSTETMYDKIAGYAKTYLIYTGFNELRQAASELITEMVNVESQMVQIDRVLNDSTLNITEYRDELIQLAYDYGNSFDNVSDITLRLAQAGFDAQQSIKLTESTLLALNTAELDATEATDDMVAVMAQWGLMQGDATEVATEYSAIIDKINRTADQFPTTSADILDALKRTSSAFNIAGASIDETIASIVAAETVSQRGGKQIGTALNNIITQLKDAGRIDIAESLGISFYKDENKTEFKDIMDIFGELSAKMQELKDQGKESSVEMQNLLEVFTVFRRNIGSSLLGEMGEGGTYNQVMDLLELEDTIGYSMSENAKYMATAEAAQQQFNATLMKLKTNVWDSGVEDVFRSMLVLGNDVANAMNFLVDTFGAIPTAIGAVTLAFSLLNKNMKIENISKNLGNLNAKIDIFNNVLKGSTKDTLAFNKLTEGTANSFQKYLKGLNGTQASLSGYITKTVLAEAATIALNTAISLGLSAGITLLLSGLDKLIHAEENARQKSEELIAKNEEEIQSRQENINTITDLIDKYDELNSKGVLDVEGQEDLKKTQKEITDYLIQQNEYTKEMNNNFDLQLKKVKELRQEDAKRALELASQNLKEQEKLNSGDTSKLEQIVNAYKAFITNDKIPAIFGGIKRQVYDITEPIEGYYEIMAIFNELSLEDKIKQLEDWKMQLAESGEVGTEFYDDLNEMLQELYKNQSNLTDAQKKYNEQAAEAKVTELLGNKNIENIEDYKNLLNDISKIEPPKEWTGSVESYRTAIQSLIEEELPEFQEKIESINGNFDSSATIITNNLKKLDDLNTNYTTLTGAVDEFNKTGQMSSATLQSLISNNLLQYLDMSSGKLQLNTQGLLNQAEAAKVAAIQALQDAAAKDIEIAATNDLSNLSPIAAGALASFGDDAIIAGQKSQTAAGAVANLAISMDEVIKAQQGKLGEGGVSAETFTKRANAISNAYKNIANNIAKINITSANYNPSKAISSGSKSATDEFEKQSDERIKIFKEEIDEYESLEKDWVDKYKELGLLSIDDQKFITQQRINRYKAYVEQAKRLTGISEEDRAELIKEYSSKVQEYELEYFDLVREKLDEQIDAFKKANEEKIQAIEDAADAEIEALQKVEDENDRIREKEEYERQRNELIYGDQGIEYWRQRTGREAQQALLEAEKELEELDRDWNEKKEEWTLEDQIQEIEDARDAQISAIEEAQEKQIEAWEAAYQQQVQLYAQTGQIIYDSSVINAGYLYNAYMDNFVNPFQVSLQSISNSINSIGSAADNIVQKTNSAANTASQMIEDLNNAISQAQSNLNNLPFGFSNTPRINESGTTPNMLNMIKKPAKAHTGGKIQSQSTESLAILKKNEVVLTPEWAAGLDKLVAKINRGDTINNSDNSSNINVYGNMLNFDDVKLDNKKTTEELKNLIVKELKNIYNIKK